MKHLFDYISGVCGIKTGTAVLTVAAIICGTVAHGQEGSSGNTTIFNGAEMTFFGNHDFTTGGGGTQPGVINTIRTAPFGILNFAASATTSTGGDDANYVDGYVRKFGTSPFIFPVGDNAHFGPFGAQGDGTMGAYYFVDPTSAVTSMLPSGNYPVLPASGPFPSATFEEALDAVSTIEYWDIDGSNATPVTLTWDAASAINALTTSQLNKLTIAGWNGTQWVAIPSKVDATSILGGTSDLTAGSITTTGSLAPDTYVAYTFASLDTPMPVTLTAFTAQAEGKTALLRWATTEETNSDFFEIQRSPDGKSWTELGRQVSQGESKVLVSYQFTDVKPEAGTNLYRLRMVDKDGTFAFSSIKPVRFGGEPRRVVYPNPATDVLFLNSPESIGKIRIINANGVEVYKAAKKFESELNISALQNGIHLVELTTVTGSIVTEKVLIRK
ncbi:T9SS type A sorting domain-containing protein [Dyadobacter jiangsuensis]|uniref:Putative secreted protein (Por secretion system target) n=1 Tax=Dyadobacter jiangsuensis TaxID=1591085 RepID=A0A2P8GC64_9BACT|nr:T9SS type A sorting domain-containing protein [Dyadobacter jiangsuensis]PSL31537.1 putative secreted protein (Por secretion system target) [Dyadobacter jiangsuensis]